jgi:hypothetical protein
MGVNRKSNAMRIDRFPCSRCRRTVTAAAVCTCAVTFVAPVRHWPFMAAEMPHTHQEQAPMEFLPSQSITIGSTVTNQGATYR